MSLLLEDFGARFFFSVYSRREPVQESNSIRAIKDHDSSPSIDNALLIRYFRDSYYGVIIAVIARVMGRKEGSG